MNCPHCGRPLPTIGSYCSGCGRPVPAAPAAATADPALRFVLPVGRSGLAIAAGYLGLLSPIVIFAPFALIVGILALRDLARSPGRLGRGRAWFGVIAGGLFTVLLVALLAAAAGR
jgi:hypothetical protein